MTAIEKLLQAAFDEVGYLEKSAAAYRANPAVLDQKTAWAGSENYTKYWRDLKPDFQGQPWCDCFVSWLFYKLFGEALGNEMLCGGLRSYYTPASANLYAAKGRLGTVPQVGDQVFFTKNGQASGCYHTGIVYAVNAGIVYTVEGNTSGASGVVDNGGGVAKKSYSLAAYAGKLLFGHPDFSLYKEDEPERTVEKPKKPKYEAGKKYRLTKSMIVYNAPSTESMIYKTSELNDYLRVKDGDKDGKLDKGATVTCHKHKKLDNGNVWVKVSPKAECWVLAYKKSENKVNLADV